MIFLNKGAFSNKKKLKLLHKDSYRYIKLEKLKYIIKSCKNISIYEYLENKRKEDIEIIE